MSHQKSQLESLIKVLDVYTEFLKPQRLLLNTHNVQFIVDNLWENASYISDELRNDLDSFIAETERRNEPVNLVKYYLSMRNSSDVASFKTTNTATLDSLFRQLIEFDSLWHAQVLTPPQALTEQNNNNSMSEFNEAVNARFEVMVKQNRFMNAKKSYEVDEMSKFVAKLCKKLEINTVL
jgi:hypothetical protein